MSLDDYNKPSGGPEKQINTLTDEFNALLERMQRPGARKAMDAAFHASPEELGKAAVEAARKRL